MWRISPAGSYIVSCTVGTFPVISRSVSTHTGSISLRCIGVFIDKHTDLRTGLGRVGVGRTDQSLHPALCSGFHRTSQTLCVQLPAQSGLPSAYCPHCLHSRSEVPRQAVPETIFSSISHLSIQIDDRTRKKVPPNTNAKYKNYNEIYT